MVEFLPNACSHQAAERVWFARVSREVERVPEREEHGIQARAFFFVFLFCFVVVSPRDAAWSLCDSRDGESGPVLGTVDLTIG